MNNFHYRNPQSNIIKSQKNTKLLQQLNNIDRQLDKDYKKLSDKRKLQQQFYEDGNKLQIANQVMKQLLNNKQQHNFNKIQQPKSLQNLILQDKNIQQPKPQIYFRQNQFNFNQRQPIITPQPIKKNLQPITNIRDIEKFKLQNKNAEQEFHFGANSKDKDKKNYPTKQSPQRQVLKNNYLPNYDNNPIKKQKILPPQKFQNPFLKDVQRLQQKREQQERNYRRLLSQQVQAQKLKKNQQRQKYKQQRQQIYQNYTPTSPTTISSPKLQQPQIQKIQNKKKRDPNAQYIPIQKSSNQIRSSDLQYMKMQINDYNNKFKKGLINYQQYHLHIKKLSNHYRCNIDHLVYDQNVKQNQQMLINNQNKGNQIINKNNSDKFKNVSATQQNQKKQKQQQPNINKNITSHQPQIITHANPMQVIEYPPQIYQNTHYQPPPIVVQNNPPDIPMQMMLKLFEELKGIIKIQNQNQMNILNDKKILQDTLSKITNPILMTQQIQASQLPQPQKSHQTEKKAQKFDNFPKNNNQLSDNSSPNGGQSQISSSYIQKSMSGIVNKIPLTKKQKDEQKKQQANKDIKKFYQKKYKIKKFKGFEYIQQDNKSNIIIPSISNYIQTKNSQQQLKQLIQKDVLDYKKLLKQRDLQLLKQKFKKQKSHQQKPKSQQNKNKKKQKPKPQQIIQHQQQSIMNPFLKKHISQQQHHPVTFTDKDFKGVFKQSLGHVPQILQQQQYQTSTRKSKSPNKQQSDQSKFKFNLKLTPPSNGPKNKDKQYLSNRILHTMKTNNQILSKYQLTPARRSQSNAGQNSISSIKQVIKPDQSKEPSSRQYFSGHDISPVQKREREYEDSLQTVRSQEQSMKIQRKQAMASVQQSQSTSRYEQYHHSPIPSPIQSPTIQSIQVSKRHPQQQKKNIEISPHIISYVQTIQSMDQSSKNLPSFQKPPSIHRKNSRSTSKKKQSVIKIQKSDNFHKNTLSGIQSQGSKQKSSSLIKAPSFASQDNKSNNQTIKSQEHQHPKIQKSVFSDGNKSGKQKQHQSIPTFKEVLQNPPFIQKTQQMRDYPINRSSEQSNKHSPQPKPHHHSFTTAHPKLKSLQQARKLAKQYKIKSGQDHNRSSVQQKLSQLQSIINTSKRQQSIIDTKSKKQQPIILNKKKDIYKILDDLDQEQYSPDFQSFREEEQK